jgi:hypothetical protein
MLYSLIDRMIIEFVTVGGKGVDRETEVLWETRSSATLFATNPIWTDLGSNPNRNGGNPVTNHLSYGVAQLQYMRYGSGWT